MTAQSIFYSRLEVTPTALRLSPRLASWEATGHPAQLALADALSDAECLLRPALESHVRPLALRLDVGLPGSIPLLDDHDLDNYVLPLAAHLKKQSVKEWDSVWCTKSHGESSFVRVGPAVAVTEPVRADVSIDVHTTASSSSTAYKQQIHDQLARAVQLPAGPVSLQLSFVIGPTRNWLNLWKPSIDALGTLLGHSRPNHLWHPRDGRITELGLHVSTDPNLRNDVWIAIRASAA
jgi:hypothetical protein